MVSRRKLFAEPLGVSPHVRGSTPSSELEVVCEVGYLRFFRRRKIGPRLSLNASKSGLSLSVSPRGAKVTVGPRGVRRTVGLPGTGLSYTSTSHRRRTTQGTSDGSGLGALVLLVILTKGRVRTTVSAFELSPETAESLACEDRDAIVGCPALADIAPQSGKLAFAICRTAVQMRPGQQGALGRRHRDSSLSTKGPGKAPKGVAAADRSG